MTTLTKIFLKLFNPKGWILSKERFLKTNPTADDAAIWNAYTNGEKFSSEEINKLRGSK